jgi:hypothetical protein
VIREAGIHLARHPKRRKPREENLREENSKRVYRRLSADTEKGVTARAAGRATAVTYIAARETLNANCRFALGRAVAPFN